MASISSIKSISDNYRVRGCISRLWNVKVFKTMMFDYKELPTAKGLLFDCVKLFEQRCKDNLATYEERYTARQIFFDMSELLLGSYSAWLDMIDRSIVQSYPDGYLETKRENMIRLRELNESVHFPSRVNITWNPTDIVSRHPDICRRIIRGIETDHIHSCLDVQRNCEECVKTAVLKKGYSIYCYSKLLRLLCLACKEDEYAWVERTGIPFDQNIDKRLSA